MNPLDVHTLSKQYGNIHALKGISFSIEPGEIFGLLGPNGAGKTTTITNIVSLEEPTSGTISVFGKDTRKHPTEVKLNLGYVPQEIVDHGYFSTYQVLQFYASFFGVSSPKKRIEYLLKRLALWNHREKLVSRLSGGMKRRLMIAKALLHEPKLLLLDEPTAGVDVELRQSLWEFIRELHADGLSILLTTHYLEEAEMLCDRIGILRQGEIVKIDRTKALINDLSMREIRISLSEPIAISHPEITSLTDQTAIFLIPASKTIGDLLQELDLPTGSMKDIHIREGGLEDAFKKIAMEN